jgi:phosphohistidine phosphatase
MKTLHLLRHAKSAWDQPGLSDRERPLNKRGRRDAPRMGAALAQRMAPMSIAVSPAQRAQLTLAGLCDGWPELADVKHYTHEELYTFSRDDFSEWITRQPDSDALFFIAHNPGMTSLVNHLKGEYVLGNLPTAGYVELALQIDRWQDIHAGCGEVTFSLFPKQLRKK